MADRSTTGNHQPGPEEQVKALYEQAESRTAKALEELGARPSLGVLAARSAENVVALIRMGTDAFDLVLRNLRLAGRADVDRLLRQLKRTEDKLEIVLQELEALRRELEPPDESSEAEVAALVAERPED